MARTKSVIDAEIRQAGISRIDLNDLTALNGNTWIGETLTAEGEKRFFEIKVIAKSVDFGTDEIEAILTERKAVEKRKAEVKANAAKKKARDEAKRAEAKAKKETEDKEKE